MITYKIRGMEELNRKLKQVKDDLRGSPMYAGMQQATLLVERDAKKLAPKDTGQLAASITPDVKQMGGAITGVVGTEKRYAPFVELGSRPHFPPMQNVAGWAARHGLTAYGVALAIAARGTKARPFLSKAFEMNESKIVDLIGKAVGEIVTK